MTDARASIRGLDRRLVPPGVADARGQAFVATLGRALEESDPEALRLTDFERVDARLLPFMVRGLSLQEFMFPGINEAIVRRFCARSAELHARKGSVDGIRFALSLIGMRLRWTDWHEADPPGDPDTYHAVIYVDDDLLDEGSVLTPRAKGAAIAAVDAMKRWSQAGSELFGSSSRAPLRAGAASRLGGTVRTRALAPADQRERAPLVIAAASRTGGLHHTTGLQATTGAA